MMNNKDIISADLSMISALKLMDDIRRKLLFVLSSDGKFQGVVSLGDIQRAIINQKSMETPVSEIMREIITTAKASDNYSVIRKTMLEKRTEAMPLIDENGFLKKVIYWEDIIPEEKPKNKPKLALPVVIMAGGKGSRLKPLTNVIPKPLIPVKEKTFIEHIMDSFLEYDCNQFYISVNYKSEIIKYYLEHEVETKYNITYFQEDKPLGTAGSLNLLKDKIHQTFFVSNCDIIIQDDYSEILKYHKENKNELTVVAALKSYNIPYGTIETKADGILDKITEKPDVTFKINTGLYILEPDLLNEVPENMFYHITDLISKLHSEGRRVGVFPVSENSWIDIGDWKEYEKIIHD